MLKVRPVAYVALVGLSVFLLAEMLGRLPGLSGDASIYWTFARSMWEQGPFYFGTVGPKHGATSPLWAFLLSLVHLIKPHWHIGFQGLSIVLTAGATISTGLLVRHLTKSTLVGLVAANILLLCAPLHRYSSAGYDTGLITLTVVEAVRASVLLHDKQSLRRWIHWCIPMAVLPLARPEGVLFFPLIAAWTGVNVGLGQKRLKDFLIVGFIAGLPSLIFYLWMYSQTGLLVPTSVRGRDLVHAASDTYWPPVPIYALAYRNLGGLVAPTNALTAAFAAAWMAMVGLGAVSLFKTRRTIAILLALLPAGLFGMMLWRNPSFYMIRYTLPVTALGVVFGTMGIASVADRIRALDASKRKFAGIAAVAIGIVLAVGPLMTLHERAVDFKKLGATIDDVLDVEGTKIANQFVDADDVAIVYEIQTQYYLECKTVAGSGIVGGEIFDYLATRDIEEFKKIGVTHIFLSNAFDYRSIFDDTIMEHLWNVNDEVPVGGEVEFRGVRLKKLVARGFQIMKPHWIAIYEVQ